MTKHTLPLPAGMAASAFRHGFSTYWFDVDRDRPEWFRDVLQTAIDVGYRRFDCNPAWDTESIVGAAIRSSTVPRDELFVTTVVPYGSLGEDAARQSVLTSLDLLGLDRLDAVLVSAPLPGWDLEGTAAAMDALVTEGVIGRIGVRYVSLPDVEAFAARLATPLLAHLNEVHPLWPAEELQRHAVEHSYWLIADSPLMQGVVGEIREVRDVARRLGATPFQVAIAWLHQLGNVATSTWTHDAARMRENLDADDVDLDRAAVDLIGGITRRWSGQPQLHPVATG